MFLGLLGWLWEAAAGGSAPVVPASVLCFDASFIPVLALDGAFVPRLDMVGAAVPVLLFDGAHVEC